MKKAITFLLALAMLLSLGLTAMASGEASGSASGESLFEPAAVEILAETTASPAASR